MRMWLVNPKYMCNKHLLGEHVELHMFLGSLIKGVRMDGYIKNELVDFSQLINRHEELVIEMYKRGFIHNSDLKSKVISVWGSVEVFLNKYGSWGKINCEKSLNELLRRCKDCQRRYDEEKNENKFFQKISYSFLDSCTR